VHEGLGSGTLVETHWNAADTVLEFLKRAVEMVELGFQVFATFGMALLIPLVLEILEGSQISHSNHLVLELFAPWCFEHLSSERNEMFEFFIEFQEKIIV
jgi:hypothetical protein